jgi:predicted transcriptional regulator
MAISNERMKKELEAFVSDCKGDQVSLTDVMSLSQMAPSSEQAVEEVVQAVAALNHSQGQDSSTGRFMKNLNK